MYDIQQLDNVFLERRDMYCHWLIEFANKFFKEKFHLVP